MPPKWNINPAVLPKPGEFPPYEFLPSVSVDYKGAKLTTNQWGMHDREYSKEKPADTFRIAILGSSHTVGIGVDSSQTFENLVEDRLNREFSASSRRKFEILNFAVSGYGPTCGLVTFERKILDFQPDAILVGGMDDITWVVNEMVNASAKEIPLPYPMLEQFAAEANVPSGTPAALAEQRLTPHAREMLQWVYQRYIGVTREHGIIAMATVLPRPEKLTERIKSLDTEQTAMMKAAGFDMIDAYSAYDDVSDPSALWIRKYDRHPNAEGHQLLADALFRSLASELSDRGVIVQNTTQGQTGTGSD
jgi:lysophospholipase L1-like esterase